MSRFDDDLRHATAQLAAEPLPPDILDEVLDERPHGGPWPLAAALTAVAAVLVIAAVIGIGGVAADPSPGPSVPPPGDPTTAAVETPAPTQPTPSPSSSPPPAEPITASVDDQGIRLTVTLDRDRTTFGERVMATATIENIGTDTVYWGHSGSCVYPASIQARPDDPVRLFHGRKDWPGEDGVLKNVTADARVEEFDPTYGFLPMEWIDFEGNFACTSDLQVSELGAGESLVQQSAWDTLAYYGMPPAPGSYTVDAAFHFMSRGAPPRQDSGNDEFSVDLELAIDIDGPDVDYISPGEAVDALLADQAFQAYFADALRGRWVRSTIEYVDGAWQTALVLTDSATSSDVVEAIVARIDARSGVVLSVALEERTPLGGE